MKKILLVGLLILVGSFLAVALRFQPQLTPAPNPQKLQVVTSFYPLAEFAKQVGQDKVEVTNLTPAGSEPHDYEPTPQDVVKRESANVFIYNGAGLEVWLNKIDDTAQQSTKMINASQGIQLLNATGEEAEEANHPNDLAASQDPHVWMDPVLASQQVAIISQALQKVDPANAEYYQQNANIFRQRLADLDTEFRQDLDNCQSRNIVTSHNAFQYLAKRYGLTVTSLSGLSPDEEPSPQKLAEVVQFSKQNKVKYIFFESLVSPKLSETIAHETGAQTMSFNPLEGLTSQELAEGKNYISVQQENLAALRAALSCATP